MCRIVGLWDFGYRDNYDIEEIIVNMRDTLICGGPDDAGIYAENNKGLALGHRRLSIIDLSSLGHQPMANDDESLWIIYNGEVYNFKEIRLKLESKGHRFQSNSDTEVILKAYEEWGIDALHQFRGMFSFAIWDVKKEKLTLVRDRVGVKPFYYYYNKGLFMFASELKAFHEHPEFETKLNYDALALFLQFGYVPAPNCIFKNAYKLEPGHYLEISKDGGIIKKKYWDVVDYYLQPKIKKSEDVIAKELEAILIESFKYRLVADVPVGVFLSGGIDSTLLTALLQKNIDYPLKTFTIGFNEVEYNEALWANKIAEYLGTEHKEYYCTQKDALYVIPKLPELYDEPFGDSSAIPTYLVSKLARQHVKVSLSADGGDELFAGYPKYIVTKRLHDKVNKIPVSLTRLSCKVIDGILIDNLELIYNSLSFIFPKYPNFSEKLYKFSNMVKENNLENMFEISNSYWVPEQLKHLLINNTNSSKTCFDEFYRVKNLDVLSQMQAIDFKTYLTDDILVKVDRATMGVSLEGREPFLDHNIVEYAAGLPPSLKYKNGISKYILRKILYKYVPRNLMERPKKGFAVPIHEWFRDELTVLFDEYLNHERLRAEGIFDVAYVDKELENYLSGKYKNVHKLWFILMFEMWYERWMNKR